MDEDPRWIRTETRIIDRVRRARFVVEDVRQDLTSDMLNELDRATAEARSVGIEPYMIAEWTQKEYEKEVMTQEIDQARRDGFTIT